MTIRVHFEMNVPDSISAKDIQDWLCFKLSLLGSLLITHPLADKDLEANFRTVTYEVVKR